MKFSKICVVCFFHLVMISVGSLFSQQIDQLLLSRIEHCVFEVVLEKPKEGKLEYAKKLPYENLPYKVRNDKYIPVGTAFALPSGKLISAAHLFSLEKQSITNKIFIRDRKKQIFPIKNVYFYDDSKDYIIFDAQGFTIEEQFNTNSNYVLNEIVYTVGNALGDGIILREGLLTSTTLESQNGSWEWLRFSAPASPGNSGGPLLNKNGEVIGIIVMKSANENLNYALPISYALSQEEPMAILHKRIKYSIALFNNYVSNSYYDFSTQLPLPIDELRSLLQKDYERWMKDHFSLLKQEWEGKTFPFTKGSSSIIHSINNIEFPSIIAQRQDGGWALFGASSISNSDIESGGVVRYGTIGALTFSHFIKPSSISFDTILGNSKIFMDLLLQGIPFYREMGGESVSITSMGKADSFSNFDDSFGRRWIVGQWTMDYVDMKLLVYALPVPDGFICFMRFDSIDNIDNNYVYDFQFMCDFICFCYQGTFSQWKEFLTLGDKLPSILKDVVFNYNKGEIEFGKDNFLFKNSFSGIVWSNDSAMTLCFSYDPIYNDDNKMAGVSWVPRATILNDNEIIPSKIEIKKMLAPLEGAPDSYVRLYNQVIHSIYPYDGHTISGATFLQKYFVLNPSDNKTDNRLLLATITHYHPEHKEIIATIDRELKDGFMVGVTTKEKESLIANTKSDLDSNSNTSSDSALTHESSTANDNSSSSELELPVLDDELKLTPSTLDPNAPLPNQEIRPWQSY